jgi:hypothetical protein
MDGRVRALLPALPALEAARVLYGLGDVAGAEMALGRATEPGRRGTRLLRDLRTLLARDGDAACRRFGALPDRSDGAVALAALDNLVRDDLAPAHEQLEYLQKGRSTLELAQVRCVHDAIGSLATLARAWQPPISGEALVLADVLARALEKQDLRALLAARGLLVEEAKLGAEIAGPERRRFAELECRPTLEAVAEAVASGEADALRLYRDPRLVPLRGDPGWRTLLLEAER